MSYIKRTLIVTAQHVPLARSLAAHLAGPPGDGMWLTGLSADGQEPATHYVSSGPVGAEFGPMLTDAAALHGAVTAALDTGMQVPQSTGVTLADCEALVESSTVVDLADESPHETFARLGLQIRSENPDPE